MNDTPHSSDSSHAHTGFPMIAGLLGVLLVLETLALGYVVTRDAGEQQAPIVEDDVPEQEGVLFPPLIYTTKDQESMYGNAVVRVDRATGTETVLYRPDQGRVVDVLAIPQVGYDGRIFIATTCGACDNPNWDSVMELDETKGDALRERTFFGDTAVTRDALEISPDQTKMAIVRYTDINNPASGVIGVVDLMTGEESSLGETGQGEYLSQYYGENTMGMAVGYGVRWRDRECFEVTIYEDSEMDPSSNLKSYKENRQYCLDEAR